jgi:DHA1 family inner membrane transport protein
MWFLVTACCALAIAAARSGVVFGLAIVGWGFVFFMGVPAAFNLLAARSNFPEERAGDAQAMMALGRVFGPIMGGALLAAGSEGTLGVVAASVMSLGGCLLLYVDRQRFVVVRQFGAWSTARASVDSPQHP